MCQCQYVIHLKSSAIFTLYNVVEARVRNKHIKCLNSHCKLLTFLNVK